MKKIISFSLFGKKKKYQEPAVRNAEIASKVYPGWTCRFYVSLGIPRHITERLKDSGAEVVPKIRITKYDGKYWRLIPASEDNVDAIIFRDTDSLLGEREAMAVSEWLESGKSIHVMRDHPYHTAPVLAGMWGCRGGVLKDLPAMMIKWRLNRIRQLRGFFIKNDQEFLNQVIYPIMMQTNDLLIHSEHIMFKNEEVHPYPCEGKDGVEFVAQIFRPDGSTNEDTLISRRQSKGLKLCEFPAYMSPEYLESIK